MTLLPRISSFRRSVFSPEWKAYLAAAAGVAAVTLICRFFVFEGILPAEVQSTVVTLGYLIVVLLAASARGYGPGVFAFVAGLLCLNLFFLPPAFTVAVEDPQNWAALTAFLATTLIAGRLRSAARGRTLGDERWRGDVRREDVWKLYQISRAIIVSGSPEALLSSIAGKVTDVFGIEYCAVFRPGQGDEWRPASESYASDPDAGRAVSLTPAPQIIAEVFRTGAPQTLMAPLGEPAGVREGRPIRRLVARRPEQPVLLLPLRVGERTVGVIALSSSPLKWETIEAIAGLVAMAFERARFLRELNHTEALKQSDELKSLLLASVSHDLRTPLTSIRAAVESLLDQELCLSQTELREFHLIISEEAQRLMRLIEDLLRMGRIEAGQLRPDCGWESVRELCDNVLDRCAAELRRHRVKVECDDALPVVKLDARLIAEAMAHLVENAAKYAPAGSEVTVRARVAAGELVISVADEGPGIAPDEVEHIFEQFYRGRHWGHHPPHLQPGGTGLGLAIARGIIEACGGRIQVESLPGCGATFTFALPVGVREAARGASPVL